MFIQSTHEGVAVCGAPVGLANTVFLGSAEYASPD